MQFQFWKRLISVLKISEQNIIPSIYTSQQFILKIFKFILALPYKKNSRKIIKCSLQFIDPTPHLLKQIISELVSSVENQNNVALSTLNACLAFYNSVFSEQKPANQNIDSHLYLYGPQQGIVMQEPIKWPFEKGGTLVFWYNMNQKTKQCKIFEFMTQQKIGFSIVMKNKKIYIHKQQDQGKFRLIKNTSAYLCQAIYNKNICLSIEFEIKKKFFQPYILINLIMNNCNFNGIQIDSFPLNNNLFKICLFKSFYGKFYGSLFLTQKLAGQLDQLNTRKGFIFQNDIRNFRYLFQKHNQKILILYSAIRARTIVQQTKKNTSDNQISDQLKQSIYDQIKPINTYLYDIVGNRIAEIGNKACCYNNSSIAKQIGNYGGFSSIIPFMNLLEISCTADDELYGIAFNQFLQLIQYLFTNKTDSIEKAYHLNFFKLLSSFINQTKMIGLSYETITRLKQIYIALNTRILREKYIQEVVWGCNFGVFLAEEDFINYIKFIKTFYNEDIQSSLHAFDITKIFQYMIKNIDSILCCQQHTGSKPQKQHKQKNYSKILLGILQIIENILMIKRLQPDLIQLIKQILQVLSYTISPCFIESLIKFIGTLFTKDNVIQQAFYNCIRKQNVQCQFCLYKCLSSCTSWKTKNIIIEFILKTLQPFFFDQSKKQPQMLTLCVKYPTMNYYRSSSVKSRQGKDSRDSVQYSQEKLSLNSATMHKLIIINPIQRKDQMLVDDYYAIQAIVKWTFSQEILKLVSDDHENPGLFILMEVYKGSTYKLRVSISQKICQNMKIIKFGPQLMAWAIQCALMAEYDLHQRQQTLNEQVQKTKQNLIQIICYYDFDDTDEQQNNQLMIIKLVFTSVKSKYPDEVIKTVGNKLFFIICQRKMHMFIQNLKNYDHSNTQGYDKLCSRIISNVFTFMNEYYVIKGDDDQNQFDQQMASIKQSQNYIIIETMQKILQIFVLVTTIYDFKIIQQANAERNNLVISIIFLEKQKDKQKINVIYQILFSLQNIFDFFQDVDIEPKKKCLLLIKKYVIYVIQLTENSGNAKIQYLEQDLKNIFLLSLSFFEQKYYQYFYYPYEKHKNIDFQLENHIRKSIDEMKKTIFTIFLDIIQLAQYIDEKGSSQHKSFYQLMKPKRKPVHKYSLKHIYPSFWKRADDKIIQFLCLKRDTLKKDAHEKLESHILLKKISQFSSNIQKNIAKKLFDFVQFERKQTDFRERKSVNFYKSTESEKCKHFCQCEEQLTEFRIKIAQQQKQYTTKQKQLKQLQKRQLNQIKYSTWNENRCYQGFWTNPNFYTFSQNQQLKSNNQLKQFYQRIRSARQNKYFIMPFIKIVAKDINKNLSKEQPIYINACQNFMQGSDTNSTTSTTAATTTEGTITQKPQPEKQKQKRRTSQKLINGLQFIKKKVYEKIAKTITLGSQKLLKQLNNQNGRIVVQDVLWIKPMRVYFGVLKIQLGKICYYHKSCKKFQHISLFKNYLHQSQILVNEWQIQSIQGFIIKRFMLKQNSIQLYLKNKKSLFLSFYSTTDDQFFDIISKLQKILNLQQSTPSDLHLTLLKYSDPIKSWDKLPITQKWLNYQISNFQYLMYLNIASGRSNNDLNQYPIMPWILSQYMHTKIKKNTEKYRDFGKNTALLGNDERIKKFQQIYENIALNHIEQFPVPHFFGFHYSNTGIILQYLIRINPYSQGAKVLQGGKFDIPDRIFYSIPQTYKCATSEISDLRQLIPQFFYFPEFLINYQEFDFGKLQTDGKRVNHVELPQGCMNAFDFIQNHRQELQSKDVSINLHKWIDLIFGYKSSGKQADKSMNTYHYLTNQANCDKIQSVEDQQQKQALQSQMAYYGKTPSQLFTRPHPQRQIRQNYSFSTWQKQSFTIKDHLTQLFPTQNSNIITQILLLNYCPKTKKYMLINKIGKGLIFFFENQQLKKISLFSLQYQKFQGINITDQQFNTNRPIQCIETESIAVGGLWGGKLLMYSIQNQNYELIQKHSSAISALKYSQYYGLLFSGAINGQLCKWLYKQKKIHFLQKYYTHSRINNIQIDEDLKVVAVCTQDGCLWLISIQNMQLIRTLKLSYPINKFIILSSPFYHIIISCKNNHQYCYTINGIKLQQGQIQKTGQFVSYTFNNFQEKVIMEIGNQLAFLKTPELSIERKIEVGVGEYGFKFVTNDRQILVINSTHVLIWRKPYEINSDKNKTI